MTKLLSDEELMALYLRCDVSNNGTEDPIGEDEFVEIFNTQKRLAAEMVIGSDWVNPTSEIQYEINGEHARQRARIK